MPHGKGSPLDDSERGRDNPIAAIDRPDGAVVVALSGELDLYNADVVRAALLDCCSEEPERLVVDLSAVEFIDSTALGVLVEARMRLANRRAFMLAAPGVETRRALEVSGLDKHFAVHGSVGDALGASL